MFHLKDQFAQSRRGNRNAHTHIDHGGIMVVSSSHTAITIFQYVMYCTTDVTRLGFSSPRKNHLNGLEWVVMQRLLGTHLILRISPDLHFNRRSGNCHTSQFCATKRLPRALKGATATSRTSFWNTVRGTNKLTFEKHISWFIERRSSQSLIFWLAVKFISRLSGLKWLPSLFCMQWGLDAVLSLLAHFVDGFRGLRMVRDDL